MLDAAGQRAAEPIVLSIARDLLAGLHAAHEAKAEDGSSLHIVHRDVTPHNLIVGTAGSVRLVDFGIAKARVRRAVSTTGQVKGKLGYMAPEQLRSSNVDRRSESPASRSTAKWPTVAR